MTAMPVLERATAPLVRDDIQVPFSSVAFTAACFEGKDWSLAPLQKAEDARTHSAFAEKLGMALSGLGARRVYAPNPTEFNAKIISYGTLENIIPLPGPVFLCRNKARPADGTFLTTPGDAGIFSAGGCGMLVAVYRDHLIFAHAGRECLLDRTWVLTQGAEKSREHVSVVDAIIEALDVPKTYTERAQVHVWPMWFIKPEDFNHQLDDPDPKHHDYNAAARAFLPAALTERCALRVENGVQLDLAQTARLQFLRHNLLPENVHMEHSYLHDELPTTRNGGGRYLVAVVRR